MARRLICLLSLVATLRATKRASTSTITSVRSSDGRFEAFTTMLDANTERVRIFATQGADAQRLTWRQVASLWKSDAAFGRYYTTLVASSPFASFFWECPPVTLSSLGDGAAFEHVTVRASSYKDASPDAFAKHLAGAHSGVVTFDNLNGDATLVAPREDGPRSGYGHLGAFLRGAQAEQQAQLWVEVGTVLERVLERSGEQPVWLSTAGKGVPWLHVRLDSEPKYYRTVRYKSWTPPRSLSSRSRRRRRVQRALEEAARAGRTEDASAEGNWPADGEQQPHADRGGAGELRRRV